MAKPKDNDMGHDSPGYLVFDVCEECGPGWFDYIGKKTRDATQEEIGGKVATQKTKKEGEQ